MTKQITGLSLALFIPVTIGLVILLGTPTLAQAADTGLIPCTGTDCNFCDLVTLGNNVLNWIFGFVFVVFGVITFIAGFGLVTSGGNQAALDAAKKKLSNAVVGLIIVFSAWLIVDTLVKAALAGTDGEVTFGSVSLGPWNSIDCSLFE